MSPETERGAPIVVTGIGVCSGLGHGKEAFLKGLLEGRNVFGLLTRQGRQADDGTNTVNVTTATDSETQPGAPTETGFAEAAGTAAGDSIVFYIGDETINAAGGTVSGAQSYMIIYQVTID